MSEIDRTRRSIAHEAEARVAERLNEIARKLSISRPHNRYATCVRLTLREDVVPPRRNPASERTWFQDQVIEHFEAWEIVFFGDIEVLILPVGTLPTLVKIDVEWNRLTEDGTGSASA